MNDHMGILNITNGDCFNAFLLKRSGGSAVPFCEVMMDGETVPDIFSEEFITLRSAQLGVSTQEYRAKMYVHDAIKSKNYSELRLWFGKDTFCQMNLLTLLAWLEQTGFSGNIKLNYIDDETFETVQENIDVELGFYNKLYEDILVLKKVPEKSGVLVPAAISLYFDYRSDGGALSRLVKENSGKDTTALICLLLENSKEYGLSDLQAEKIINRVLSH